MKQSDNVSLPKGWEIKKLGEIGKVSMCKRIMKDQTLPIGEIPFYKIGTFGKKPDAFISKEIYDEFRVKYPFPKKGEILISASGTIGRRVKYDGKPAYFQDSNIVWLSNDEKQVINDYLYRFYEICNWKSTKGATISRLYNDNLRQIEIAYPKSLPEQHRIVSILDRSFAAIDKAKANAEQNLKNAKELFESYLDNLFENKGDDWEIRKLGEVSKINYGYTEKASFEEVGPKFLRITDIQENGVVWETVPYCRCSDKDLPKYKLETGDIVFARTGATTGKSYLIENPPKSVFASYLIRLRMNSISEFVPEFISYFFQTKIYWDKINAGISGSAQGGFNATKLSALEFHFPKSKEVQQLVVRQLDSSRAKTQKLESIYTKKILALEELKKSVLQKAFRGEL